MAQSLGLLTAGASGENATSSGPKVFLVMAKSVSGNGAYINRTAVLSIWGKHFPMFLPFLTPLIYYSTILPLSVPFRHYWTLLNPKFHSIWSSGSILMAKSNFSIGQKSAQK